MAQGRSTKVISMMKWIRTRRLSIKNSLSEQGMMAYDMDQRVLSGSAAQFELIKPFFSSKSVGNEIYYTA